MFIGIIFSLVWPTSTHLDTHHQPRWCKKLPLYYRNHLRDNAESYSSGHNQDNVCLRMSYTIAHFDFVSSVLISNKWTLSCHSVTSSPSSSECTVNTENLAKKVHFFIQNIPLGLWCWNVLSLIKSPCVTGLPNQHFRLGNANMIYQIKI